MCIPPSLFLSNTRHLTEMGSDFDFEYSGSQTITSSSSSQREDDRSSISLFLPPISSRVSLILVTRGLEMRFLTASKSTIHSTGFLSVFMINFTFLYTWMKSRFLSPSNLTMPRWSAWMGPMISSLYPTLADVSSTTVFEQLDWLVCSNNEGYLAHHVSQEYQAVCLVVCVHVNFLFKRRVPKLDC